MSPSFTRQSQGTLLRKPAQSLSAHAYGAITLCGGAFQVTSASPSRERPTPYPTSAPAHRRSVRFRLFPLRSPLLRKSQLVSPPPPTKMFQFGGFPLLTERRPKPPGSPIQASPDLRLHAPPRGLSQLATPFVSTQAKPSTRQRSISANFPVPQLESEAYARRHREGIPQTGRALWPFIPDLCRPGIARKIRGSSGLLDFPVFLGGDPAARSRTATLLRLNPPYRAQIRRGQLSTTPHLNPIRVVRRAVCAKSRDVFTAG